MLSEEKFYRQKINLVVVHLLTRVPFSNVDNLPERKERLSTSGIQLQESRKILDNCSQKNYRIFAMCCSSISKWRVKSDGLSAPSGIASVARRTRVA